MLLPNRGEEMTMRDRMVRFAQATTVLCLGAAFAVLGLGTAVLAQNAVPGSAANGKRIYLADGCFQCHGRNGQGGAFNYPAPALVGMEIPVESFVAFLRNAPNDMPSYDVSVLPDKDAADIYAFLQTLPGRKPAKEIPLLNQ
jgi:mono/diheme cytochrome c family protein